MLCTLNNERVKKNASGFCGILFREAIGVQEDRVGKMQNVMLLVTQ